MRRKIALMLIATALVLGSNGNAMAADKKPKIDVGKYEYQNSCSLCHGIDGKNGLPANDLLKNMPPDLTTISKRNGGVFPFDRIYAVIDGTQPVFWHGTRDMPAWGDRYSSPTEGTRAAEYYVDVPYDMGMYARSRIMALIDYVNRIQVK